MKQIRYLRDIESRPGSSLSMSFSGSFSDNETTNSNNSSIILHTKRKPQRKKSLEENFTNERKRKTLKQHYYPEGHWGWFIIVAGVMVHCFTHGFHLSSGVFYILINKQFGASILAGLIDFHYNFQHPNKR